MRSIADHFAPDLTVPCINGGKFGGGAGGLRVEVFAPRGFGEVTRISTIDPALTAMILSAISRSLPRCETAIIVTPRF